MTAFRTLEEFTEHRAMTGHQSYSQRIVNASALNNAITDGIRASYTAYVRALEKWLEDSVKGNADPIVSLEYVKQSFDGNILANVQYHRDMESRLAESNNANANFHARMAEAYESMLSQVSGISNLVTENNSILKEIRRVIEKS